MLIAAHAHAHIHALGISGALVRKNIASFYLFNVLLAAIFFLILLLLYFVQVLLVVIVIVVVGFVFISAVSMPNGTAARN